MQRAGEHDGPGDRDTEAGVAHMEVDLTPPKKRAKSAQISRHTSVEADTPHAPTVAHSIIKHDPETPVDSTLGAAITAADAVKSEPVEAGPLSATLPAVDTTPVAIKAEPETFDPVADPALDLVGTPVAKKKKSSAAANKAKKGASSKKASASTAAHAETSASGRGKVKIESKATSVAAIATEEEEEEDDALYCVCKRRQDDVEGGMIACDRCDQWYHYRCMEITEDDAELVDRFVCPPCHEFTPERTTYKAACARAGCRHAAQKPFSKYCSERCGVLALSARLTALKVTKNKQAVAVFEADPRVLAARKTEAYTHRTHSFAAQEGWAKVVGNELAEGATDAATQRLGLAGAFALLLNEAKHQPTGIGATNGTDAPASAENGWGWDARENDQASSGDDSSATSLIGLAEQMRLVARQMAAVDLEKTQINARLDRLDLRSTLLHLASDRVPTLTPAPTASAPAPDTADAADEDQEMADEAPKKAKKKKGAKGRAKDSDASLGPLCGYDQRLHWDDPTFDAWAQAEPGRSMLVHEQPLDGQLDDTPGSDRLVCASVKRKCRRHIDWSNLCELALDAEKTALNAHSRLLTHSKLDLAAASQRLEAEYGAVAQFAEQQRATARRAAEQRDQDMARAVAAHGTRRAVD